MRIKVINPNTTPGMTATIGVAARSAAASSTEIICVNPTMGPVSIEGHYDEAIATIGVLDEVRRGEADGIDAYVIACFGDPGLRAARELARGPVIGIAEAAMHVASLLSTHFSIVTTLERTIVIAEHLVRDYGFERQCRRVRAADIAVLELEESGSSAREKITDECRRALAEDRSGAIVLGCAGMANLCDHISSELGVPVVDGVTTAVKLAEMLVSLGLHTSKHGDFAYPLSKQFNGMLNAFAV